jgi:hypothetical protein
MPIDPEKLLLDVKGATAGATPHEAAVACFKRDGETEELTDREVEIADLWETADEAAIRACCSGWAEIPSDAQIMLAQK